MGINNVKRYSSKLESLKSVNLKERRNIIDCADDKFIIVLCECCLNVLNGFIKLSPREKKILSRYSSTIRVLGKSKLGLPKRRSILRKSGGFIRTLVNTILKQI